MSYIDVIDKILDSKDATVGGGSASAICGAMAAGLMSMVARLSINKDCGLTDTKYLTIAEELDLLSKELLAGSAKDTEAYLLIKNAFAMPKATETEKAARSRAVCEAGVAAAIVPKENGYLCKRVYELGASLVGKSNDTAYSDLIIGVNLARLGIEGCVMNMEANLPLIKDEKTITGFKKHMDILRKKE